MAICDRCGSETIGTIMSKFNTENICMNCKSKEREHPEYDRACEAEMRAVKAGDYNYPGIGKPSDL